MTQLLLSLLCSCCLLTASVTHMAAHPLSLQRYVVGLQAQTSVPGSRDAAPGRIQAGRWWAHRATSRPGSQAAASLALPATAFGPAHLVVGESGAEDNAAADAGPFAINHSASYSSLGRVTGYYQHARWQPSGTQDTVDVRYMGSIFTSPDTAHTGWQDGVRHTQTLSGIAPTDCSAQARITCSYGGYLTQQSTAVVYFALQYNQCLIEISVEGTRAVLTAQASQLITAGAGLQAAAEGAAEAACTTQASSGSSGASGLSAPPSVDLLALSVRTHAGVNNAQHPAIKRARLGKRLYLYAYYALRSGQTPARVSIVFTVKHGGKVDLTRRSVQALDTPPPSQYYEAIRYKPRQVGMYRVTVRLTVGAEVRTGHATFSVVT